MVMNVASALSAYQKASTQAELGKGISGKAPIATGESFEGALSGFLGEAMDSVRHSEQMAAAGAMGKADLQEVILAVSNAEMMMQTVTSIRDKVIAAYQEVMRTAI